MLDPTRDDLLEECEDMGGICDIECAIYYYALMHHTGQNSNLYSVLSTSQYKPGMIERGPIGESLYIYKHLENTFGGKNA